MLSPNWRSLERVVAILHACGVPLVLRIVIVQGGTLFRLTACNSGSAVLQQVPGVRAIQAASQQVLPTPPAEEGRLAG